MQQGRGRAACARQQPNSARQVGEGNGVQEGAGRPGANWERVQAPVVIGRETATTTFSCPQEEVC